MSVFEGIAPLHRFRYAQPYHSSSLYLDESEFVHCAPHSMASYATLCRRVRRSNCLPTHAGPASSGQFQPRSPSNLLQRHVDDSATPSKIPWPVVNCVAYDGLSGASLRQLRRLVWYSTITVHFDATSLLPCSYRFTPWTSQERTCLSTSYLPIIIVRCAEFLPKRFRRAGS